MRAWSALLLLSISSACGRAEEPPPPTAASGSEAVVVVTNPAPVVIAPNTPFMPGQTWRGSYVCAQGPSGLALRMLQVTGPAVEAAFDFDVPQQSVHGSYVAAGQFDAGSGRLQLEPVRWIVRPAGYEMVGLVAQLSPDGTTLRGSITNPNCSTLEVRLAP